MRRLTHALVKGLQNRLGGRHDVFATAWTAALIVLSSSAGLAIAMMAPGLKP